MKLILSLERFDVLEGAMVTLPYSRSLIKATQNAESVSTAQGGLMHLCTIDKEKILELLLHVPKALDGSRLLGRLRNVWLRGQIVYLNT